VKEHIYHAEAAVLGSIVEEPDLIYECTLQKEDFGDPRHQKVMEYFRFLEENDEKIDPMTMARVSGSNIEKIGGYSYLIELQRSVVSTASFGHYQSIVRDASLHRQSMKALGSLGELGASGAVAGKELVEAAQSAIEDLSEKVGADGDNGPRRMSAVLHGHEDKIQKRRQQKGITGAKTASIEMDKLTGGHQDGDLEILGARPSIGKTAYMIEDSIQSARSGYHVYIFSLEMEAEKIAERFICNLGNIDSTKLRTGNLGDDDWERWSYAMDQLDTLPIFIDDTPGMTLQDIGRKVKRAKKASAKLVIYIDFLQLVDPGKKFQKNDEGIAYVSKGLKRIARVNKCPVIAISAVSRKCEERQDKRPMMSDLRESGSIESDADIVTFLYRDDYYDSASERKGIMELILAKGRNVGTGKVEMAFVAKTGKFLNLDRNHSGGAKTNGGAA